MFGTELFLLPVLTTFLIGISTIVLLYRYGTRNHEYWKKRGIPYAKPVPFFGNVLDNFRTPLHEVDAKRYNELGPIYGHFEGNRHLLTIADPTLLRDILVKDFQNFNRRREFKSGDKILDNNISAVDGEDWKRIRSIITPSFTTGKMKRMLSIFIDCSKTLMENFKSASESGKSLDAKKLYGAFSMDVIASSAFSTKIDSHNDIDNHFVRNARILLSPTFSWRFAMFILAPRLMKIFHIAIIEPKATDFFINATLQIVEQRKATGQVRNDFLQLLLDTAKETAEEDNKDDIASNYELNDPEQQIYKYVTKKNLTMNELVAQCIIFFMAGYETTASTLSFASYMLALNQGVQDKLRQEVDAALKENKNKLTYEVIHNLKYLDNVISETLRMFPPGVRLDRIAESDYKLGDTGITIEKETLITVPIYSLHRNPEVYPDPERFDPNRFSAEEKAKRDQYAYLPFGAGPRNCIGMRFALMEIKVCLAQVISSFVIKRSPKTKVPLEYKLGQQGTMTAKEILLDFEIRKG